MVKLLHYGLSPQLLGYCASSSHKKKLKILSNSLKTYASTNKLVSLSALQIGETVKHFVMLNKKYLKDDQWITSFSCKNSQYEDILNAQVTDHSPNTIPQWQECRSYPGLRMLLPRYPSIKLTYMDLELTQYTNVEFQGFQALILQHELDHYYGLDFVARAQKISIVDSGLRDQYQQECDRLLSDYLVKRKDQGKEQDKIVINDIHYSRLKQFLTYSIIDSLKQP